MLGTRFCYLLMPEDKLTLGEDQVHWPLVGQVLLGSVDWVREGPQIVCLTRQSNACISKSTWYASAKSALICLSIHEEAKLDRFFHDSQAQAITLSIFFEAVEMRWGNGQQVIAITRGSRSQYLPILSGVCCSSSASVYYWWSLGILEIVFSSIEVDHFSLPSDHSSASLHSGV